MDRIIVKLRESTNILSDMTSTLSARSGFIGDPSPVLPVYFYRYLGIDGEGDDAKSEYYNELFLLDRRLATAFPAAYLKLTNNLPPPSYEESLIIPKPIESSLSRSTETDSSRLAEEFVSLLPRFNNSILDNTMAYAFRQVLAIYLKNEPQAGISVVKNVSLKLVVWINRYLKQFDLSQYDRYPKILYYGKIKPHEVYLLLFLAAVGCDVLYISPDVSKDAVFQRIDKAGEFTKMFQHSRSEEIEQFPQELVAVRKSTVAHDASAQIQAVIYGADMGIFKPWQLENHNPMPVTLKTTYDELKILWQEEARMRPDFKVENDTVFIPNLFAKISGTTADLVVYWQDLWEFMAPNNTCFISSLPFTRISYSKSELYSSVFLLNKEGLLDLNSLVSSPFYRFVHLRTSLQNLIQRKMNRLISSKKGEHFSLKKNGKSLNRVFVGLGWQANPSGGVDFDLDSSVFMLGSNGKVVSKRHFVFFNNLVSPDGSVQHKGDELVGGEGEHDCDCEQVRVLLTQIPDTVEKLVFTVTVYEARQRRHNFGLVSKAYIRIVDEDTRNELARFDLAEDYSLETAIIVAEINREGVGWKFSAIGQGLREEIDGVCKMFGL